MNHREVEDILLRISRDVIQHIDDIEVRSDRSGDFALQVIHLDGSEVTVRTLTQWQAWLKEMGLAPMFVWQGQERRAGTERRHGEERRQQPSETWQGPERRSAARGERRSGRDRRQA